MSDPARLALALADHLTSEDRATRHEAARRLFPTSLVDQLQGATTEAETIAMTGTGVAVAEMPAAEYPQWVVLSITTVFAAWVHGTARLCDHRPSLVRPEPVLTAAWMPDTVVCEDCQWMLGEIDPIQASTCDGCGGVVDRIVGGRIAAGGLIFLFGVCDTCRW